MVSHTEVRSHSQSSITDIPNVQVSPQPTPLNMKAVIGLCVCLTCSSIQATMVYSFFSYMVHDLIDGSEADVGMLLFGMDGCLWMVVTCCVEIFFVLNFWVCMPNVYDCVVYMIDSMVDMFCCS